MKTIKLILLSIIITSCTNNSELIGTWEINEIETFIITDQKIKVRSITKDQNSLTETVISYSYLIDGNQIICKDPDSVSKSFYVGNDGKVDRSSWTQGKVINLSKTRTFQFKKKAEKLEIINEEGETLVGQKVKL